MLLIVLFNLVFAKKRDIHDVYIYSSENRDVGLAIDKNRTEFIISKNPTMFKIELKEDNNYYIKAADGNYLAIVNNRLRLTPDKSPWILRKNKDISEKTRKNHYQLQSNSNCLTRNNKVLGVTQKCNIAEEGQLFFFVVPENDEDQLVIRKFFDRVIDARVVPVDKLTKVKEEIQNADLYKIILTRSSVTVTKTVELTEVPDKARDSGKNGDVLKVVENKVVDDEDARPVARRAAVEHSNEAEDPESKEDEVSAKIDVKISKDALQNAAKQIDMKESHKEGESRRRQSSKSERKPRGLDSESEEYSAPSRRRSSARRYDNEARHGSTESEDDYGRRSKRSARESDYEDSLSSTIRDPRGLMDETSSSKNAGLIPSLIADINSGDRERRRGDNVDDMFRSFKRELKGDSGNRERSRRRSSERREDEGISLTERSAERRLERSPERKLERERSIGGASRSLDEPISERERRLERSPERRFERERSASGRSLNEPASERSLQGERSLGGTSRSLDQSADKDKVLEPRITVSARTERIPGSQLSDLKVNNLPGKNIEFSTTTSYALVDKNERISTLGQQQGPNPPMIQRPFGYNYPGAPMLNRG